MKTREVAVNEENNGGRNRVGNRRGTVIVLTIAIAAVLGISAFFAWPRADKVPPVATADNTSVPEIEQSGSTSAQDPEPKATLPAAPSPSPTRSEAPQPELRVIKGDIFRWSVSIEPRFPRAGQSFFFDVTVVNPDGPQPAFRSMEFGDGEGVTVIPFGCTDEEVRSQRGPHEYNSASIGRDSFWKHTYEKTARYIATISFTACGYSDEQTQAVEYEFSIR